MATDAVDGARWNMRGRFSRSGAAVVAAGAIGGRGKSAVIDPCAGPARGAVAGFAVGHARMDGCVWLAGGRRKAAVMTG